MRTEARLEAIAGAALLAAGAVWLLAPDALGLGKSCPFHALTGYPCLSCGGTRALAALRALDLGGALAMNPLVTLGALGLAGFLLYAGTVVFLGAKPLRPDLRGGVGLMALRIGLPLAIAANWLYLILAGR